PGTSVTVEKFAGGCEVALASMSTEIDMIILPNCSGLASLHQFKAELPTPPADKRKTGHDLIDAVSDRKPYSPEAAGWKEGRQRGRHQEKAKVFDGEPFPCEL